MFKNSIIKHYLSFLSFTASIYLPITYILECPIDGWFITSVPYLSPLLHSSQWIDTTVNTWGQFIDNWYWAANHAVGGDSQETNTVTTVTEGAMVVFCWQYSSGTRALGCSYCFCSLLYLLYSNGRLMKCLFWMTSALLLFLLKHCDSQIVSRGKFEDLTRVP